MVLSEFIKKYNGKKIDWDGYYGAQCVDLAEAYNREVNKVPTNIPGNACDFQWTYPRAYYTWVTNYWWTKPKVGDIVVWRRSASLPYGHVGVISSVNGITSFYSFDQNWPTGWPCHNQYHRYSGVAGFLRRR